MLSRNCILRWRFAKSVANISGVQVTFSFARPFRLKPFQTILLVLLSSVSGGVAADYVRWTATSVASSRIPEPFLTIIEPGESISLSVWIDLAAENKTPNQANSAWYELAQVQGYVGSYAFNSSRDHFMQVADGLADGFQVTVSLTSPPNASGFVLGQFAFFLYGGPDMLSGVGVPSKVADFTTSGFDVEACPLGYISCTYWNLGDFTHGSTVKAQVVSSLTPVPIPPVSTIVGPILVAMGQILCKRTRA